MCSMLNPIKTEKVDQLHIQVYETREKMGKAAAIHVTAKIQELLRQKDFVRIIFAAAPSQNEFFTVLKEEPSIDWSRIIAFHMDEYIGLSDDAPERFGQFLTDHLFKYVQPKEVHFIDSSQEEEVELKRYGDLINEAPIDIVCLGIGENGHIAFNDPPVADFNDPKIIKVVELDAICRQQQVNDGAFAKIGDVPTHAMTLTISALMSGQHLYCMVPGVTKRKAVREVLRGPITVATPASVLRRHPNCTLYVDKEAYGE